MTTKAIIHFDRSTEFLPLRVLGTAQYQDERSSETSVQAAFTPSPLEGVLWKLCVEATGDDEVNAAGRVIQTARNLGGTVKSLEYISP